jgi:hypothetical protein
VASCDKRKVPAKLPNSSCNQLLQAALSGDEPVSHFVSRGAGFDLIDLRDRLLERSLSLFGRKATPCARLPSQRAARPRRGRSLGGAASVTAASAGVWAISDAMNARAACRGSFISAIFARSTACRARSNSRMRAQAGTSTRITGSTSTGSPGRGLRNFVFFSTPRTALECPCGMRRAHVHRPRSVLRSRRVLTLPVMAPSLTAHATGISKLASTPLVLISSVPFDSVNCIRGDLEEAERLAHEATGRAARTDFLILRAQAVADLAEVLRLAGRQKESWAALEEAVRLFEQKGNAAGAARAWAAVVKPTVERQSPACPRRAHTGVMSHSPAAVTKAAALAAELGSSNRSC